MSATPRPSAFRTVQAESAWSPPSSSKATPGSTHGYDVTDHYAIDPRLGTFGDFDEFMTTAADRGLRVIADLVVNHTSVEHPWLQDARRSREPRFRPFYAWRAQRPDARPHSLVLSGEEGQDGTVA